MEDIGENRVSIGPSAYSGRLFYTGRSDVCNDFTVVFMLKSDVGRCGRSRGRTTQFTVNTWIV